MTKKLHYLCCLETGRDFVITAEDDMDAAYTCDEYAAQVYDDYLIDVEPMQGKHDCFN